MKAPVTTVELDGTEYELTYDETLKDVLLNRNEELANALDPFGRTQLLEKVESLMPEYPTIELFDAEFAYNPVVRIYSEKYGVSIDYGDLHQLVNDDDVDIVMIRSEESYMTTGIYVQWSEHTDF